MTHTHPGTSSHGGKGRLVTGSILSIILTAIPFWMVMNGAFQDGPVAVAIVFILAMAQVIVHVSCFLHVDRHAEGGWTLLAFVFTAIILGITIIGSIWVMYHLNTNMMPMSIDG